MIKEIKKIVVKRTVENSYILTALNFYYDSPHWQWVLLDWIHGIDNDVDISLTFFADQEEADSLREELIKLDLDFYCILNERHVSSFEVMEKEVAESETIYGRTISPDDIPF